MPNFLIHSMFAIVFGLLALSFLGMLPTQPIPLLLTIALLGISGIIPDLDHEMSISTRMVLFALSLVITASLFNFLVSLSSNLVGKIFTVIIAFFVIGLILEMAYRLIKPRHRGVVHSYIAALSYALLVYILAASQYYAIVAGLGFVSHLWADGLFLKIWN